VTLHLGRAESLYAVWPRPICIVSDGAYGVKGFPGDPPTHEGLAQWYRPHVEAWARYATAQTTLWFWNTEIGWATVHPLLVDLGWEYRSCHVWNKGLGHVAGNANSATLRKFPVVTEVCVQYVKPARFEVDGSSLSMRDWLRREWRRSGLPLQLANRACGVRNAATRKYLTGDHLWYYPPVEAFEALARYANEHGAPSGKPYFSRDGVRPLSGAEWATLRAKFHCQFGVNNVWNEPPVRGPERLKRSGAACVHGNQKPLRLIDTILRASTDEGDVVWEPFGGLCSVAIAALRSRRVCYSAEPNPDYLRAAAERIAS
jgi:site-specific DNA-methyltransferase (adenine-specific)